MIIHVLRKPLTGTVAANVLTHGCGALNIDGCRVGPSGATAKGNKPAGAGHATYGAGLHGNCLKVPLGVRRWPANLVHDGSKHCLDPFPHTSSGNLNAGHKRRGMLGHKVGGDVVLRDYGGDSGSASRFFQQVTIE